MHRVWGNVAESVFALTRVRFSSVGAISALFVAIVQRRIQTFVDH